MFTERYLARSGDVEKVARRSLVRKLVLLVAAAVTSGMVVSSLLAMVQEVKQYADARRQLMQATAQAFAAAVARPLAELKQQETLEAIRAIARVPGLQFVQVRTPDWKACSPRPRTPASTSKPSARACRSASRS